MLDKIIDILVNQKDDIKNINFICYKIFEDVICETTFTNFLLIESNSVFDDKINEKILMYPQINLDVTLMNNFNILDIIIMNLQQIISCFDIDQNAISQYDM